MDVVGEDEGPGGEGRDGDDDDDDEDEVRPLAPSNGSAAASSSTFPPAAPSSSLFPPGFSAGRRTSVSAESLHPKAATANGSGAGQRPELPTYPKSPQQLARIRLSIASNFLFRNLDDDQSSDVLSAMKEVRVGQGEVVIRQGDVGDYFYVIEEGQLEVFKSKDGEGSAANGGLGDKVATTGPGMSFGELALMYKCAPSISVLRRLLG
jgi:cAMP-dependent protein kinase regulator